MVVLACIRTSVVRDQLLLAVQSRPSDDSEWQRSTASLTVKPEGPLWHEDRPLMLGVQAVVDDPKRLLILGD